MAGRQRKPKKQFTPEPGKKRKVIESLSIPPTPVPPKIPINSSGKYFKYKKFVLLIKFLN